MAERSTPKLWIRVDAAVRSDPNVAELASRLNIEIAEAVGHCVLVWCAIAEHCPTGNLVNVSSSALESWAGFKRRQRQAPGAFAAAFRELFLSGDMASGWRDRQGKLIEKAERERARKLRGSSAETPRTRNGTEQLTTTTAAETAGAEVSALPEVPSVPKQKKGGLSADGQRVWDFYQALHPRARVDEKLSARITKALKSYSADDLCHAIQGCHEDDWHATRGKTDLAYILRDSNNVALFLAKYDANNAPLVGTDGNLTPAGQRYFAGAKS